MQIPLTKPSPFQPSSIFWRWWSGIRISIGAPTDLPDFNPKKLSYDEIGDAIANGSFAFVAKIKNKALVIKAPFNHYKHYTAVERHAYKRIGHHRFILRYYGQADVILKGEKFSDLILQYHRPGTLKDSLNNPNYTDTKSE
jgi:hypothetical protein